MRSRPKVARDARSIVASQSGGSSGSARDSETRGQHRANSLFVTPSRANLSMTRSTKLDRTDVDIRQQDARVSELLNDLAVAFDGQYFAQITRYYVERRQSERSCHHSQLELFVVDDVAF